MLATKKDLKEVENRLKESVDSLNSKIFKKEEFNPWSGMYLYASSYIMAESTFRPKTLEERFFNSLERVEKRQELLMKHLGLKFVEVEAIGEHEEIRKVKESTSEPSSRKKTCKKCGEERPITDYHKNKNNKSGRRNVCKFCISEYMKEYALKH